ncbi:imidazole glycerol phosphate synthase subunit HisH [Oleiagrimonas sp. MCCC 1A03011]|uniref:imidazole glycerol phosphate synthase subunit HisH n=1 Tax=Oleiagrimonas sp. MCCC 1A03011 TaxID=1926883 RepID=UPI000DC5E46B|nr:imidazole glycerol phosphate synthase subunit HisH [Oleiagrimonas sp. MCCC 1A03011]RAP56337.1 imidazole glycerol phosphate synthase subunit HisH [Oleiagrimonas sp. MCCC 1A03011]
MADVVLIDAGGTNIGSVQYALQRLGVDAAMSGDPMRIRAASHVILPGVGAAPPGMARLRMNGLDRVVRELEQPVLGVCLGMQLLFEHSEEGDAACLGVVPGEVRHFPRDADLRVPHMGWNRLHLERDDVLLRGVEEGDFAYFVHSYAAAMGPHVLASSDHGAPFAAVVRKNNFCGMQFHPERSADVGARLLENFLSL